MAKKKDSEERNKHIFYLLVGLAFIIIGASSIFRTIVANQIQLQLIKNSNIKHPYIDDSALVYTLPVEIFADVMLIIIGFALIFLDRFVGWLFKD